jgi:tripartite-type tricarboxylate transporter receptor subunit TctC
VTSAQRLPTLPNVPTVAESGLPGFELAAWVGVFVRAGTPPEIVARLDEFVTAFLSDEATRRYLAKIGAAPFPATPEELKAFEEADTKRWAEIVAIGKIEKK